MTHTTFVQNTNLLEVRVLKSAVEDEYINDADVVLTSITDYETGEEVDAGTTVPLVMNYVDGTDGWYRCTIDAEVELVADRQYVATIDADAGPGRIGHWEFIFKAKTRRST